MSDTYPKISIVTPSFNQGKFIEKTILSVIEQDYPNLEYIIIDGGSTDESVEIINKYEKHLAYWVSEPDRGQSHAINKGFEKATGEIFGWLNSDDWYHPGALKAVAEAFAANPEAGAVVGAGEMVDEGECKLIVESFEVNVGSLYNWIDKFFMQPSCFFRSETWRKCGPLDENIHFAMDLDLWIRIAKENKFVSIVNDLSVSLVHKSAKTTAQATQSIVDAAFVIIKNGGLSKGTNRLVEFMQELYDARHSIKCLEAEKAMLIRDNHELKRVGQWKDQKIHALENSLSWRITSPLRRLGKKLSIQASQSHPSQEEIGTFMSIDEMSDLLNEHPTSKSTILLLDFTLGGGSSLYSRNLIANLEYSGHRIILLEYRYHLRDYHIEFKIGDRFAETCPMSEPSDFFQDLLNKLSIDLILVNQLVSWPDSYKILTAIKDSYLRYQVFIHDYFMICPNYNIFDLQEKFCGIPEDPSICKHCLENIIGIDIPFEHYTNNLEIETWRKNAGAYLAGAENVICFSGTSMKLLMKAFPLLNNLTVNEHYIPDPQLFTWKQRSYGAGMRLTIAVIGGMSVAKGSKFIDRLINSQEFRGMPVRIVILGEINPQPRQVVKENNNIKIHGSYNRADLRKLLEEYDTSIVMIPSLCPETFCYTASEAMLLGYPVVCFDLGAQAERVRRYNCGWVVSEPYLEGALNVIGNIIANPEIVREKSMFAKNYVPLSAEKHFSLLNTMLGFNQ